MEAVIVVAAALVVIVLLDASYRIALCLLRWAPSLLLGMLVGWIALRHGAGAFEATALFALTTLIAQRVLVPNFFADRDHWM